MDTTCRAAAWVVRITVGLVFLTNVACALEFVVSPGRYTAAFELQGVPGRTMVRGIGVLFLMWNATYPPVLWNPWKHRTMMGVVLLQQAVGLVGETWMWATLPAGHGALQATGLRFILFDGVGLPLMSIAFGLLLVCARRAGLPAKSPDPAAGCGAQPSDRE